MQDNKVLELVEEIALAVISIDPEDKQEIGSILNLIEGLEKKLPKNLLAKVQDQTSKCQDLLTGIIFDSVDDMDKCTENICEIVSTFQQIIQRTEFDDVEKEPEEEIIKKEETTNVISNPAKQDTEINAQKNQTGFTLPDWIDEATFREFIKNQPSVLDEIEGNLMDIEAGKAGAVDAFKRIIHTLKGEAGVIGLEGIAEVCHAMEDMIEAELPLQKKIDLLLQTKDWIAQSLKSYAKFEEPEVSPEEISKQIWAVISDSNNAEGDVEINNSDPETKVELEIKAEPEKEEMIIVMDSPAKESSEADKDQEPDEAEVVERDSETVSMMGDFLAESKEGLAEADQLLMELEQEEFDLEKINALFRVFHSIKGVAGFLELGEITSLAHVTETMLNKVRQGTLEMNGAVSDLLFDATAMMDNMLDHVRFAAENNVGIKKVEGLKALIESENQVIDGKVIPDIIPTNVTVEDKFGEVLQKTTTVKKKDIDSALNKQAKTGKKIGKQLLDDGTAKPKQIAKGVRSQKQVRQEKSGIKIKETVKIDLDRVDGLLEMIGELVIVESMVVNAPEVVSLSSIKTKNYLNQLGKITRDLQTVGMQMRMEPVRGVFQKMARMVRDLSRKGGKSIDFVQVGETTEMDRSMVEHISDPLVHMIRNSVDHGIEATEEERVLAGKSAKGEIKLSAYHEGGKIVIEISDDGNGLNKQAIMNKAISQNLHTKKELDLMSDTEIFNLIFAPGFSTAKKVTEISGRGVGMDVVRRNIESMRGRILISSKKGKGTTFKMMLPLTLAIIDGMLIACGNERYIIPTLSIIESIKPTSEMLSTFAENLEMVNVRDEILPLLRLDGIFGIENAKKNPTDALVVIVESFGKKVGLLVDDVISQQQVVIKNMSSGMNDLKFISGAAIMSDGKVGLIMNVEEISEFINNQMHEQKKQAI